eukprot:5492950-Pyramimonas_sp.AAC.1
MGEGGGGRGGGGEGQGPAEVGAGWGAGVAHHFENRNIYITSGVLFFNLVTFWESGTTSGWCGV